MPSARSPSAQTAGIVASSARIVESVARCARDAPHKPLSGARTADERKAIQEVVRTAVLLPPGKPGSVPAARYSYASGVAGAHGRNPAIGSGRCQDEIHWRACAGLQLMVHISVAAGAVPSPQGFGNCGCNCGLVPPAPLPRRTACRMPTPEATPHRLAEGEDWPILRLAGLQLRPVRGAAARGKGTVS